MLSPWTNVLPLPWWRAQSQKKIVSPTAMTKIAASRRRRKIPATRQPEPARRVGDVASATGLGNYETGYF
jgi:hypothetical protein